MTARFALAALIALDGVALAAGQPLPASTPVTQPAAAPQGSAAPAAQPTLGRLFFAPEQRAALDESRRRPPAVATTTAPPAKELPPAPEYVSLDGIVRRSDGTTSIWVNNRMMDGRRTGEGLEVVESKRAPGNVTVRVPQAGRSVELRVGQQLEVNSGKITERYQSASTAAAAAPAATRPPAEPADSAAKAGPRRPAREREMLRDLLREMEGPAAERNEPRAESKG